MQFGANCLAGRTPFHGKCFSGEVHRRVFVGGWANGIPRNAFTSNEPVAPSLKSRPSTAPDPSGSSTISGFRPCAVVGANAIAASAAIGTTSCGIEQGA
jgi:hypothetical protein